jgi:hypothetical protein
MHVQRTRGALTPYLKLGGCGAALLTVLKWLMGRLGSVEGRVQSNFLALQAMHVEIRERLARVEVTALEVHAHLQRLNDDLSRHRDQDHGSRRPGRADR